MSEVRAKLSRLPVSGFKVRLLADQIRGKYVSDALDILSFSKKSSSKNVKTTSSFFSEDAKKLAFGGTERSLHRIFI